MSQTTRTEIENLIAEFAREIARNEALAADSEARYPWRRHDARIYRERAETAYLAAQHLVEAL